ncbi:MAG: cytochrome c [Pseudomonadota bacterium]|nr:cytochrome c [Pseudomonadota bacterium]
MRIKAVFPMLFGLLLAHSPLAHAMDEELAVGQRIFEQNCASCHGPAGDGDGEISVLFKEKPRALSQLAKENGGEYPFELVYQTLKATRPVQGHGVSAMPVWGNYFEVEKALGDRSMDDEAALIAVGKLLSVVYYIETLQDE